MAAVEVSTTPGGVMYLTLNRPKSLNAINGEMRNALYSSLVEAEAQPSVRCVVISGNGRAFCSGGDVKEMGDGKALTSVRNLSRSKQVIESIVNMSKPVIAGINGVAVGAGLNLALACDLIVASERAEFSEAFSQRGLIPDMGGTYFLARQVGMYRAKELVFSGRKFSAQEAKDLGIVTHIWPHETFSAQLARYADNIARSPTVALGFAKRMINRSFETDLATALELETFAQGVAGTTEDHQASVRAFRDKSEPTFTGQ